MQPNICQGKSNNQKIVYRLVFASKKSTNKGGQGDRETFCSGSCVAQCK